VTVPRELPAAARPEPAARPQNAERPASPAVAAMPRVASARAGRPAEVLPDDRERLGSGRKLILLVEDDPTFARIMYDLAHELGFDALIATTGDEGVRLAAKHVPSAVVLDIGLPDTTGLSVLDRLKDNERTRHIPVHIVSAGDHAQMAYAMGAAGYLVKPVRREELAEVLHKLESQITQRIRRVLIVEDDAAQRESLRHLLGSPGVELEAASSAAECLQRLSESTYDCMVLDLTLPDSSGFALLEQISQQQAYSFPPVIVYTGRDLSSREEEQLRRYAKSVIIKGAKSPERLLDEVTLFLHQVVSTLPAEQQSLVQKARSRDTALEGRRILVVEDDVRNVFALTSILEPRGARVQIARNGREALEAVAAAAAAKTPVDLVLMDVMMPEMDGLTATRELRKRPDGRKLPIIVLTAKATPNDQTESLEAGANDYIAKPLDVDKLLSLIRVWMPR
jgi:CheY-like chemotaxis protein